MSYGSNTSYSSALKRQFSHAGILLGALDAISNWRAFLLLGATFIAVVVELAVCGFVSVQLAMRIPVLGGIFGLLTSLLAAAIALVGINATGILFADEVWARPQRTPREALAAAFATSHRLVVILLIELLLFLLYLLALALVFFVCKLPFLGPVLYAFVLPAAAILTGVIVFSLAYIAIPLAAPAVWNGLEVRQALLMLKEIARTHLLHVVTMMVLLGISAAFIVGIIYLILFSGTGIALSLSGLIVGSSGSISLFSLLMGAGGTSGYAYALGFGFAVLTLAGFIPGILIGIKGASIIYREASEGISLDALEAEFENLSHPCGNFFARRSAPPPLSTPAQPDTCPACNGAIGADDAFCGNCGGKLK